MSLFYQHGFGPAQAGYSRQPAGHDRLHSARVPQKLGALPVCSIVGTDWAGCRFRNCSQKAQTAVTCHLLVCVNYVQRSTDGWGIACGFFPGAFGLTSRDKNRQSSLFHPLISTPLCCLERASEVGLQKLITSKFNTSSRHAIRELLGFLTFPDVS